MFRNVILFHFYYVSYLLITLRNYFSYRSYFKNLMYLFVFSCLKFCVVFFNLILVYRVIFYCFLSIFDIMLWGLKAQGMPKFKAHIGLLGGLFLTHFCRPVYSPLGPNLACQTQPKLEPNARPCMHVELQAQISRFLHARSRASTAFCMASSWLAVSHDPSRVQAAWPVTFLHAAHAAT